MMKINSIQNFIQNEYEHAKLPKLLKFDQFHNDTGFKGNLYQPTGNILKNNIETKIGHINPYSSTTKKINRLCINDNRRLLSDLLGI